MTRANIVKLTHRSAAFPIAGIPVNDRTTFRFHDADFEILPREWKTTGGQSTSACFLNRLTRAATI